MLKFYIYISLLLIMFFLMTEGIYLSRLVPIKIKIITMCVALTMLLRYCSLLILSLAYNIKYLYLLKPLFFINFISVPLLALTVLYIFMRKDNINFSYIFILAVTLVCLYSMMIYKSTCLIRIAGEHGYTMILTKSTYVYWCFIAFNTIVLFLAIDLFMKNYGNKTGIILIIVSCSVTILELIMWLIGINLFQGSIIGDMLWGITMLYALTKISKREQYLSNRSA